jgi:hypothetical protein
VWNTVRIQLIQYSVKWRSWFVLQKLGRRACDASDLFLLVGGGDGDGGGGLDSRPGAPTTLTESLLCFPQLFQVNIGIVYCMRPNCFHRRPY